VSSELVEQAPAKINLTLRVTGRRPDGYHELESLVVFADLADTLTLESSETPTLDVAGPFAAASGKTDDNLVLKAFDALDQRIEGLKAGRFTLEKKLPVAAGIGGGSADAAAALRLLALLNGIAFDDARLADAARAVGADVPVCVASQARIMRGIGEQLSPPLALPALPAVLVNPGLPLETRAVFAKLVLPSASGPNLGEMPRDVDALIELLKCKGNDLTQAAAACLPQIVEVLDALAALPGVRLARMSGSGPTCFALFASAEAASAAAQRLQAAHRNWWIAATTLGSQRP
jgi:4-diphosphocytidyl-2-C-methyl-D-erythritol kinase